METCLVQMSGSVQWDALMQELGINKLPHHITEGDVVGKKLESVLRWQEFYNAYSRWMGFSVRKNNVRKDEDGSEWQRLWVCSREGFRREKWINLPNRKKAEKCNTRTGCRAKFAVTKIRSDSTWKATAFDPQHNHELASLSEIQFLRSHRRLPGAPAPPPPTLPPPMDTCDILDCVALEPGARARLAFVRKDVLMKMEARRNGTGHETDAEGALGYLTCHAIKDRDFFCKFTVGGESRLDNLFWSDGASRRDYAAFGDVLALDANFGPNAYNRPVLVLAGLNHHGRTAVFGTAVLSDETTETYEWVLEQFLACMDKRPPRVVVTDGGPAMLSAVSTVVPTAVHRLCAGHLEAAATRHVSSKEFEGRFSELIYEYFTEAEFDEKWRSLVAEFKLEQSEWARSVHDRRRNWAETFLRGNFFGGMRTTGRCELMEAYLKRFSETEHLMRDFVCQLDAGVAAIRYAQAQDDYESKHGEPEIPQDDALKTYYSQFAKSYTKAVYEWVSKEIKAHHSFSVTGTEYSGQSRIFRLNQFLVGEIWHQVRYDSTSNTIGCSCLLFETEGIPCRHVFTVMKFLNMSEIPPCLFSQRWKNSAGDHVPLLPDAVPLPLLPPGPREASSLAQEFDALAFYALQHEDMHEEARRELAKLTARFRELVESHNRGTVTADHGSECQDEEEDDDEDDEEESPAPENVVQDSDHSLPMTTTMTVTGKDNTQSKGNDCNDEEEAPPPLPSPPPAKKRLCSQPPNPALEVSVAVAPPILIRHFVQLSPIYSAQSPAQLPNLASNASSPAVRHFTQLSHSYSSSRNVSSSTGSHLQINSSTNFTSN